MEPRRNGSLPPGRNSSGVHRRVLRVRPRGNQGSGPRTYTFTDSHLSKCGRERRRWVSRYVSFSRRCVTPALAHSRARQPRSSTTECASHLCPDKIRTAQWAEVMLTAHDLGLRSTATMMFGHIDRPRCLGQPHRGDTHDSGTHRGFHRIRSTPVRPHGGADLRTRNRSTRPHVGRGCARPLRRSGSRSTALSTTSRLHG